MIKPLNVGRVFLVLLTASGCNSPDLGGIVDAATSSDSASSTSSSTADTSKSNSNSSKSISSSSTSSISSASVSSSTTVVAPISTSTSSAQAPSLNTIPNKNGAETSLLSFALSATDPQSQSIVYSCVGCPSGLAINASTGAVSWTPALGQVGVYTVTFKATNSSGLSSSRSPQLSIAAAPPAFNSIGSKTVAEGASLSFAPTASDPYNRPVTISLVSSALSNASFASGTYSFNPNYYQAGNYTVTFKADNGLAYSTVDVPITVTTAHAVPQLNPIANQSTSVGQHVTFTATSTVQDGDTPTYTSSYLPPGATMSSAGVFDWPNVTCVGPNVNMTITATNNGGSSSQSVVISVDRSACTIPSWGTPTITTSGTSVLNWSAASSTNYLGTINNYAFNGEYDCANRALNRVAYITGSSTFTFWSTWGAADYGSYHYFKVQTVDSYGYYSFQIIKVLNSNGNFVVNSVVAQGASVSTTGLCGGGTVYAH